MCKNPSRDRRGFRQQLRPGPRDEGLPCSGRLILQIAGMSALPALPLLLLVVPVTDNLEVLGAVIL